MKILLPVHTFSDIHTNGMAWGVAQALACNNVEVYVVSNHTDLINLKKKDLHSNIKLFTIGRCGRSESFDNRCLFWSWLFSIFLIIIKRIDFIYMIETVVSPFHRFRLRPISVRVLRWWDYSNSKYGEDLKYDRARKKQEIGLMQDKRTIFGKAQDFFIDNFFKSLKILSYWRSADIVFYQAKESLNLDLRGYPAEKIFYQPNGVDPQRYKPLIAGDQPRNKFVFLFVGYLGKRKGIEYLVKAFNQLAENYLDAELWLIGRGAPDTVEWLQQIIKTVKIKLLGKILPQDMPKFYNQADCFVLPSLGESFSTAMIEAMACAKPVITTNLGGALDFIINDKNGYLVEPAETNALYQALEKIYLNQNKAKQMGELNRQVVLNNFTWDKVGKIIVNAFESLN